MVQEAGQRQKNPYAETTVGIQGTQKTHDTHRKKSNAKPEQSLYTAGDGRNRKAQVIDIGRQVSSPREDKIREEAALIAQRLH